MADRKVSVALELQAGQFKAEADVTKAKVEGLDRKVTDLDRDITKIPPDAAKAAAALKLLGDESGKAGLKLDDSVTKSSTSLQVLDGRLAAARGEVRKFADEFNRTGNTDALSNMLGADKAVRELERFRARLVKSLGDAGTQGGEDLTKKLTNAMDGAGQQGGQNFLKQFAGQFSGGGGVLVPALVGVLISGAPLIGGTLNAALLSGIGLGGIGLGIAGQFHNPAVHAAMVGVGNDLLDVLHQATVPFGPALTTSLQVVGAALHSMLAGINFSQLADALVMLSRGLAGMISNLGPGLNDALSASIPVLRELAHQLPNIGTGLSVMFHLMAGGSEGAVEALRLLVMIIVGALVAIGALVRVLSDVLSAFVRLADGVTDFARKVDSSVPGLGYLTGVLHDLFHTVRFGKTDTDAFGNALTGAAANATLTSDKIRTLTAEIGKTKDTVDTAAAKMTAFAFNTLMAVDQATISWHQSLLSLHDMLAQNGTAIDRHTGQIALNTKGGLENRSAILAAVSANMQIYQANIAAGMSAQQAADAYDVNTTALHDQLRAAGLTEKQVQGMIGTYKAVPKTVNTIIAMKGLEDAIKGLDETLRLINHLNGYTATAYVETVHINKFVAYQRAGGIVSYADGGIRHAAGAGIYPDTQGPITQFAEPGTGKEGYLPMRGISRSRATGILSEEADWYGYGLVDKMAGAAAGAGAANWGAYRSAPSGGAGGTATINLNATFVDGATGEVTHKKLITYALNTGQAPADLFPASSR